MLSLFPPHHGEARTDATEQAEYGTGIRLGAFVGQQLVVAIVAAGSFTPWFIST